MSKTLNIIYILTIVIAGYLLFTIKTSVHDLTHQITNINNQITKESNEYNILKAEFACLSSAKRLHALTKNHLELSKITAQQITRNPLLNDTNQALQEQDTIGLKNTSNTKRIAWRYKHVGDNVIRKASHRSK